MKETAGKIEKEMDEILEEIIETNKDLKVHTRKFSEEERVRTKRKQE